MTRPCVRAAWLSLAVAAVVAATGLFALGRLDPTGSLEERVSLPLWALPIVILAIWLGYRRNRQRDHEREKRR